MTAAEATVDAMLAHGIDTIYALPGVQNDQLFEALFKASDRIRTVHTRHEQGAAYMALGAALATGKPQAYAVVPGPGLLNSAAALLTAYSMNAPVLALVGQIPRPRHRPPARASARDPRSGRHHQAPGGSFARWSGSRGRRRELVAEALRAMATGRPGPGRAGMRDQRVGQAGPGRRRMRAAARRGAGGRRDAMRNAAKRLGAAQKPDDRGRRRRAGGVARSHARWPPCCRRRCSAIGAAAACSTAAIRSA